MKSGELARWIDENFHPPLNANIFYDEGNQYVLRRVRPLMEEHSTLWRYHERPILSDGEFTYERSVIRRFKDGYLKGLSEVYTFRTFDDFRELIAPIARECGPRILDCLGPIARNDPRIRNAASPYWWKMVREYVVKRRFGFYWHDQTKHLMQENGVARKRDREAFEADRDDVLQLAKR
jgi:hypothetical protein